MQINCPKCNEFKQQNEENFHFRRDTQKFRTICKTCINSAKIDYNRKYKAQSSVKEHELLYRQENKARKKAYDEANYKNNKELIQQKSKINSLRYYHKNKENILKNRQDKRNQEGRVSYKSIGECIIQSFLNKNNIEFKSEISLNCRTYEGNLVSFDFYLKKQNLVIEFHGAQHYKFNDFFHKTKKEFFRRLRNDKIKKEYCLNNKINFLEISYKDIKNIENILKKQIKKWQKN